MRHFTNERGSALVELSLVLPLFLLMFVGTAELGRMAYASIEVVTAARSGVAYGSQNHITASDTAGMAVAAKSDGPNVAPITVSAGACICPASAATTSVPACNTNFISYVNPTTSGTTTNTPVTNSFTCPTAITATTEYVQVNTTATVQTMAHYLNLPSTFTLNGSATMVVEQ
jgi:Flp pilus assembly protein TadG